MKKTLIIITLILIWTSCNSPKKNNEIKKQLTQTDSIEKDKGFKKLRTPNTLELEYQIISENNEDISFFSLSQKPEFPGGYDSLAKFIIKEYKRPESIPDSIDIIGRVKSTFIVNKQGKVVDVEIIEGFRKDIDLSIYNVISKIPDWKPAEYRSGEKVALKFLLPIVFVPYDYSEKKTDSIIKSKVQKNEYGKQIGFSKEFSKSLNDFHTLTIDFDSYKLKINDYNNFHKKLYLKNDTLKLDEGITYNLSNKLIEIISNNKKDKFEISVSHELVIRVSLGEKRIYDLENWTKITSYEMISDSYIYRTPKYDIGKFRKNELKAKFETIKSEILKLKGEFITNELKKAKNSSWGC
jgi:hypothetical protein